MNFDSFSHGQVHSKIWLCEELEKFLPQKTSVVILGGWYNLLSFMLLCRNPNRFEKIKSIDIDPNTVTIADKITNAWTFQPHIITNEIGDANNAQLDDENAVYINCSPEHFDNTNWFYNLPIGSLVCIQSVNVTDPGDPWFIKQPTSTFEEFLEKYNVSSVLFKGKKRIQYNDWGYDRFMVIGYK